jgi:AcrR family transcriptional regulator
MPRVGLDTATVVSAAAELIERRGFEALTLSALASELGVRPPSLYAHVGGLDDLRRRLTAFCAEQLADAIGKAGVGLSRADALRAVARAYRGWVLQHPNLYLAIESGAPTPDEPSVERVLEIVLSVLRGYGLEQDAAIHAARTLRAALNGFTSLESGGGFAIPVDLDESFEWMLSALDRAFSSAGG